MNLDSICKFLENATYLPLIQVYINDRKCA